MNEFLVNVLLVFGLATTPTPSDFQVVGHSDEFSVELDVNSIKPKLTPNGWEIKSTLRLQAVTEFQLEGKRKKGAYYVDEVTISCKDTTLTIDEARLFAKDGEILAIGRNVGKFSATTGGDFVPLFIEALCKDPKIIKPGTMI